MPKEKKCTMCRFIIKELERNGEVHWYCTQRDKEDVRMIHGNLWMPTKEGGTCERFEDKH